MNQQVCQVIHLGMMEYQKAWQIQLDLVVKRRAGKIPDTLLLVEHPPVITEGRGTKPEHLLAPLALLEKEGISVFPIERGGDITYHGPGQLVAYPILDLKQHGQDLHRYLRDLEEVVIRTLACYNVTGTRSEKYTGVWVGSEKICAIGVAVKGWVSYHGIALNLNTNLNHFKLIVPCGIYDHGVTSLAKIMGRPVDEKAVEGEALKHFSEVFQLDLLPAKGLEALESLIGNSQNEL